jgi:hypothetical protein
VHWRKQTSKDQELILSWNVHAYDKKNRYSTMTCVCQLTTIILKKKLKALFVKTYSISLLERITYHVNRSLPSDTFPYLLLIAFNLSYIRMNIKITEMKAPFKNKIESTTKQVITNRCHQFMTAILLPSRSNRKCAHVYIKVSGRALCVGLRSDVS